MQASLKDIAEQIDRLSRVRRLQAVDRLPRSNAEPSADAPRLPAHRYQKGSHGMIARAALVAYGTGLFLALVWILVCPLLLPGVGRHSSNDFVNLMAVLSVWLIPSVAFYLAGLSIRFVILGDGRH